MTTHDAQRSRFNFIFGMVFCGVFLAAAAVLCLLAAFGPNQSDPVASAAEQFGVTIALLLAALSFRDAVRHLQRYRRALRAQIAPRPFQKAAATRRARRRVSMSRRNYEKADRLLVYSAVLFSASSVCVATAHDHEHIGTDVGAAAAALALVLGTAAGVNFGRALRLRARAKRHAAAGRQL